jgi:predicted RNase H-like HicB family nuclease
MKLKVIVHDAEEGGFWAEVPSIPGCATQGESFEELLKNLYDAIEGCLSVEPLQSSRSKRAKGTKKGRVLEIAV